MRSLPHPLLSEVLSSPFPSLIFHGVFCSSRGPPPFGSRCVCLNDSLLLILSAVLVSSFSFLQSDRVDFSSSSYFFVVFPLLALPFSLSLISAPLMRSHLALVSQVPTPSPSRLSSFPSFTCSVPLLFRTYSFSGRQQQTLCEQPTSTPFSTFSRFVPNLARAPSQKKVLTLILCLCSSYVSCISSFTPITSARVEHYQH